MKLALIGIAVILFALDFAFYWRQATPPWYGRFQSLGLAFFAGSFITLN